MVIDDQLNILPISSHTLTITALPPKSKVIILVLILLSFATPLLRVRGGKGVIGWGKEKGH